MKKSTVLCGHVCPCQCWEHLSLTWQDWEGTLKSNYVTEAWLCFSGVVVVPAAVTVGACLLLWQWTVVKLSLASSPPPPPLPSFRSSHSAFTRGCYHRKSSPGVGALSLDFVPSATVRNTSLFFINYEVWEILLQWRKSELRILLISQN